jgi:mono/diheme cytochrome c family protein|tara:strand:+ start:595 stop:1269 length:675 start_codon:yes stop_codon:yes gene_type:complete
MPRLIVYIVMLLLMLALIPPVVVARTRATTSEKRPIHLIQDMDIQAKFKPQTVNPIFADQRSMRPEVVGTVARGETQLDTHLENGVVDGDWSTTIPLSIDLDIDFMERGQGRFNIYCAPCHGWNGMGNGPVNARATALMDYADGPPQGTSWTQARNLHDPGWSEQPVGQIYNTITNGKNSMAGYGSQVSLNDRWAIAVYVKALQRSQNAVMQDIPADKRGSLGQ